MKKSNYGARHHGHKSMRRQIHSLSKKLEWLIERQKKLDRLAELRAKARLGQPILPPRRFGRLP